MTIRPTRWWFTAITITGRFYIMFAVLLLCVAGVVFGALRTTELRSEASADLARAAAVQRSLDRALTVLVSITAEGLATLRRFSAARAEVLGARLATLDAADREAIAAALPAFDRLAR